MIAVALGDGTNKEWDYGRSMSFCMSQQFVLFVLRFYTVATVFQCDKENISFNRFHTSL